MLPSPMPITILDSVSEPAGTPLWASIVSWVVTLVAAVFPAIFSCISSYRNRKDLKTLEDRIIERLNQKFFYEESPEVIKKLKRCQTEIDKEHFKGRKTYNSLRNTMLLAKNLAKLRKFNDTDMKTISDFTELVCNSCNLSDEEKDWNTFSRKIPDIIFIFQKGDYQA